MPDWHAGDTRRAVVAVIAFIAVMLAIAAVGGGWLALGRVDPLFAVPGLGWAAAAATAVLRGWRLWIAALLAVAASALLAGIAWIGSGQLSPWPLLSAGVAVWIAMALAGAGSTVVAGRGSIVALAGAVAGAIAWQWLASALLPLAYERGRAAAPVATTFVTSLPIGWNSDADWFAAMLPDAALRPVDALDDAELARAEILLLAHPRPLSPAALVAIDRWVHDGGRAVILADGLLSWEPQHPLGDPRNPPVTSLLAPLLSHWGVRLDAPAGLAERMVPIMVDGQRVHMFSPGSLHASQPACSIDRSGMVGDCRIGRGRALIVADADVLHPDLWSGGAGQPHPYRMSAANALWLNDKIAELAGRSRPRAWAEPAWWHP
jgi:hypothetical protein